MGEKAKKDKGFWNKIKAGVAVLLASLSIAIPTIKYAKDKDTKSLDSGTSVSDSDRNVRKDGDEFRESLKVSFSDEDEKVYSGLTYDDLLKKLDSVASKNNYNEVEYKYSKAFFDGVYNNYDSWKSLSKGMPTKEKYTSQSVIDVLADSTLNFISTEGEEGKRLIESGSPLGYTEFNNGKAVITILYNPKGNSDEFNAEVQRFAHETAHAEQKYILTHDDHFKGNSYLRYILTEGRATTKMKFVKKPQTEKMAGGFTESGNIMLEYKIDDGEGYPKEYNFDGQLNYFAGYDVLEGVTKGDDVSNIEKSISEGYGQETAKKILDLFKKIEMADLEDRYDDEFKYEVELENIFLDCIKKDITNLRTKKDIEKFTNIYRGYMINYLPRVYKDTYTDITNEYFPKVNELNNLMADKIYEVQAFDINDRTAADSLVYTQVDKIYERPEDYYWVFIPVNLNETEYRQEENGAITFRYQNPSANENDNIINITIRKDRNEKEPEVDAEKMDQEIDGLKPMYDKNDKGKER